MHPERQGTLPLTYYNAFETQPPLFITATLDSGRAMQNIKLMTKAPYTPTTNTKT